MRNLNFRHVKAENILCFGSEGIELNFDDHDNIVLINGINLDNPGTDTEPANNGAGKSSVQELLSIGLYGKTVKNPSKVKGGQIVHALSQKGFIDLQWDDFRLVRTFRRSKSGSVSSKLQVWESPDHIWDSESEKTQGKTSDTQQWIEDKIGFSHHVFCHVLVFDDSGDYSFLEADAATKRQIVENLLGLDQYREYHDNAKHLLKIQKQKIQNIKEDYQRLIGSISQCENRLNTVLEQEKSWKVTKQSQINELLENIKQKQQSLTETSDTGKLLVEWENAQTKAESLRDDNLDLESKIAKISAAVSDARQKLEVVENEKNEMGQLLEQRKSSLTSAESNLASNEKLISSLKILEEGTKCPTCHGVISKENFGPVLLHAENVSEGHRASIRKEKEAIVKELEKFHKKASMVESIREKIKDAESKTNALQQKMNSNLKEISRLTNLPKPEADSQETKIENDISNLKKQLNDKKKEYEQESPYTEIIKQVKQEAEQNEKEKDIKSDQLENEEKDLGYYQFWVEAFGDNGIRKYVVDGMVPALNARISHWLQHLIDNCIELEFDNKFEQTIRRNGTPAYYYSTSKGERRRIDLAVSQAFAYIMMLDSGSCPSLVFLDEITGGSIDRAGVSGVYNMVFELAKERQVFVTTHNQHLLDMFQGCDTLTLKKENDATVLL